jgi:hypothetical protein
MQRGSIIIYDNNGKIWINTGDAEGDILPNEVPAGLPYIETQFGELTNKRILSVDIATATLITENIPVQLTYEELQQQLLIAQGVI